MAKIRVGVAGYGVIGQRLADGVALQEDMELVGVADVAPTLSVRALMEKGMPYALYTALPEKRGELDALGIPISGTLEDLVKKVDVMLDATSAGIGAKNKELYAKYGKKGIFQGGEKDSVADVFFHGYANYEKGLDAQFLKLTSCNTTGLIRAVDCIDRKVGVERVAITIIRRVADPGDYHRGLTNALQIDKAPSHQALDLMTIMPHVSATGILVHTPVTHGHIITVVATGKGKITKRTSPLKMPSSSFPNIRASGRCRFRRDSSETPVSSGMPATWAIPAETCTKSPSGGIPSSRAERT